MQSACLMRAKLFSIQKKATLDMKKLIIVTAPSGAGKTTIVRHLLNTFRDLAFSVSATNRTRRPLEIDGKDYYFLSDSDFNQRIKQNEFLEYEEVYAGQYYGTLNAEMERLWALGKTIVFDVDVKGATNIKKAYPLSSLAVFIQPPSEAVLIDRLKGRKTETPESLKKRIARAKEELTYCNKFDTVIVNDKLADALDEAEQLVSTFLNATITPTEDYITHNHR
jgi:guanylate kinase